MEEFLLELQQSVIDDDVPEVHYVLYTLQNPEYQTILARAYVYHRKHNELNREEFSTLIGSKAKNKSRTSIANHPIALYKLIVKYKMHKLRRLCPTKEQMKTLLTRTKQIREYLEKNPDSFWISKNEEVQDNYHWWIGI